jgi:hypothetical protein
VSYLSTDALQVRLREVLEAAAGTLRTITAATYGGNLAEELTPDVQAVRSLALPQIEALITDIERSPSSPPTLSNVALYKLAVRVKVTRRLTAAAQLVGATRDLAKSAAARDADVLNQALGFPGNLRATNAAAQTGLVSGLLTHEKSTITVRPTDDDGTAVIDTDHRFTGTIQSSPAT